MDTEQLINELKISTFLAECPKCNNKFNLSKAILFDGLKDFPKEAIEAKNKLKQQLKEQEEDLKKRKKSATKGSQDKAREVGVGKNLEKVLPTMKDFKWTLSDSRFLSDPIDLIIFNGVSLSKVDSINFVEVKSGNAKLNKHQKSIRDAVVDKKVSYKEYK